MVHGPNRDESRKSPILTTKTQSHQGFFVSERLGGLSCAAGGAELCLNRLLTPGHPRQRVPDQRQFAVRDAARAWPRLRRRIQEWHRSRLGRRSAHTSSRTRWRRMREFCLVSTRQALWTDPLRHAEMEKSGRQSRHGFPRRPSDSPSPRLLCLLMIAGAILARLVLSVLSLPGEIPLHLLSAGDLRLGELQPIELPTIVGSGI
jgi:hypothetical protein